MQFMWLCIYVIFGCCLHDCKFHWTLLIPNRKFNCRCLQLNLKANELIQTCINTVFWTTKLNLPKECTLCSQTITNVVVFILFYLKCYLSLYLPGYSLATGDCLKCGDICKVMVSLFALIVVKTTILEKYIKISPSKTTYSIWHLNCTLEYSECICFYPPHSQFLANADRGL